MGKLKQILAGLALSGAAMTSQAAVHTDVEADKQDAVNAVAVLGGVAYAMADQVMDINASLSELTGKVNRNQIDMVTVDKNLTKAYYAQHGVLNENVVRDIDAGKKTLTDAQKKETILNSLKMYEKKTGQNMSLWKEKYQKNAVNPVELSKKKAYSK